MKRPLLLSTGASTRTDKDNFTMNASRKNHINYTVPGPVRQPVCIDWPKWIIFFVFVALLIAGAYISGGF
jgi:hypothetical protein